MSTYQGSTTPTAPGAVPVTKPATLTAGFWLALVTGVLGLIGGIVMITGGRDSIRKFAEVTLHNALGSDASADLINSTISAELDDAYHKLVTKAVIGIVASLLIVLFAVLARNASTGARVGLTISLVISWGAVGLLQLGDRDVLPSPSVIIASITPLLGLVAIILLFLPATKRYASARTSA